jgi:hypothetical protein
VVAVSYLLAGVNIDPDRHLTILAMLCSLLAPLTLQRGYTIHLQSKPSSVIPIEELAGPATEEADLEASIVLDDSGGGRSTQEAPESDWRPLQSRGVHPPSVLHI